MHKHDPKESLVIDLTRDIPPKVYTKRDGKVIFTADPGLTVLVGRNGIGKTTLLDLIKEHCEREQIPHILHDNLGNDRVALGMFYRNDIEGFIGATYGSEGENIIASMGEIAGSIGRTCRTAREEGAGKCVILIDALDSGLSINNILDVKRDLFDLIIEDNKDTMDIYIIVAANSYELARGEDCVYAKNMDHVTFDDYDDYRKFILRGWHRKE